MSRPDAAARAPEGARGGGAASGPRLTVDLAGGDAPVVAEPVATVSVPAPRVGAEPVAAAGAVPADDAAAFSDGVLRVEEQIVVLFRRAKVLWASAAASVHPDLQPVGYRLLSSLVRLGPTNPGRLAEIIETDKSVVSRQARVLEALGLVTTEPDPHDGRGRLLRATSSSNELVASTRHRVLEHLKAGLEGLTDEELNQLASLMARLNDAVESSGFTLDPPAR